MRTYFVKTPISISAWEAGPEHEVNAIVGFKVHPARAQTQLEPAEHASVEVTRFTLTSTFGTELACPDWLSSRFTEDENFLDFLMSEARDQDEAAADDRADAALEARQTKTSA